MRILIIFLLCLSICTVHAQIVANRERDTFYWSNPNPPGVVTGYDIVFSKDATLSPTNNNVIANIRITGEENTAIRLNLFIPTNYNSGGNLFVRGFNFSATNSAWSTNLAVIFAITNKPNVSIMAPMGLGIR